MKHLINRSSFFSVFVLWGSAALAEHYTLPLFVTSTSTDGITGVVRILNMTAESGSVEIYAIDDAGMRSGPATLTLNASAAADFSASDLISGNAMKGLSGSIGTVSGDVRLQIDTDLHIIPAAYVRAADGTLSTMHDVVPARDASDGGYEYLVPIFNHSAETAQASRLRLINPGDAAAAVTIEGRDDSGTAATGMVGLTLAAGVAQTLTAQQLEAGDTGLTGQLGTGLGKWRLSVTSDQRLHVVSVVSSTSGYMNNLSTSAATGPAPRDHEAFNERFVDTGIEYQTDSGDFAFSAETGDRFTETGETDGTAVSRMGSYEYEAIVPHTGRVTMSYDGGDRCTVNLHFSTFTNGWFASFCASTENPGGYWVAGNWSIPDDSEDDGDRDDSVSYGVNDALPGVPTSGVFAPPALVAGVSITSTADGTTITLNDSAYFELADGTRYACASPDGCAITNGTVTRGTVTGTPPRGGAIDLFPTFRMAAAPGNQTYTAGTAIDTLVLPEASSGNGTLTYSLSPSVPGLTFNATARQLIGTPSTAGTHAMTYTVRDEDGDTDSLSFSITVSDGTPTTGSLGVCRVGMLLSMGQSCTYPGTDDAFSVNVRGRGRFLDRLAGIRIRINNETINGRVYDFEASHQGDGVWRIDRIDGSTVPANGGGTVPTNGGGTGTDDTESTPSVPESAGPEILVHLDADDLNAASGPIGFANGRFYVLDRDDFKLYAYSASGQRDSSADIELDHEPFASVLTTVLKMSFVDGLVHVLANTGTAEPDYRVYAYTATGARNLEGDFDLPTGDLGHIWDFTYANEQFHVLATTSESIGTANQDERVFAYSASGERVPAADFDLPEGSEFPEGITYAANDRFYLYYENSALAYRMSGERDPTADLQFHIPNNTAIGGIAYANGGFYVTFLARYGAGATVNSSVYAFSATGERNPAADFDLIVRDANSDPRGIAYADGRYFVIDGDDSRAYAYSDNGQRTAPADIHMNDRASLTDRFGTLTFPAYGQPEHVTSAYGLLYVITSAYACGASFCGQSVNAFSMDTGEWIPNAGFSLPGRFSASYDGIAFGDGRFYILTRDGPFGNQNYSIRVYSDTGTLEDRYNVVGSAYPSAIAYANGRIYGMRPGRAIAFSNSGERIPSADIELDAYFYRPAITIVNGQLLVVDGATLGSHKVFAFNLPTD